MLPLSDFLFVGIALAAICEGLPSWRRHERFLQKLMRLRQVRFLQKLMRLRQVRFFV